MSVKVGQNPNHFSQPELRKLLQQPDDQLSFNDFRTIFHWRTPAGTYEEVAYFLPLALEHMRCAPDDAREFIDGIICFASEHAVQLTKDQLFSQIEKAMRSCFEAWTNQFLVEHFDEKACQDKGWNINHYDYVNNSEIVRELIESLTTSQDKATRSAWLLEYAREAGVFMFEHGLLQRHYKSIEVTLVANEPSPTYWKTIRKELDLSE